MGEEVIDTIVVGAGQAGLATSHWLKEFDVPHVVLERGTVANSWITQRWDSFHLNTPNQINNLPGDTYKGDSPWAFVHRDEAVDYFKNYGKQHDLPIEEGVEVTAVRRVDDGFEVETKGGLRRCRNLVLCSGDQNDPRTPSLHKELPADITQMHTENYRRPEQLPEGSVLVVGAGQSGVQIVEDLLEAERKVYLCTSAVGRVPRSYRGKDIIEWIVMAGLAEHRPQDLEDPAEVHAKQGQISGTRGGHTVCLHEFGRQGVTLLGRLRGVSGRSLQIGDDLKANVAKGDEAAQKLRAGVDMIIEKTGIDAPPAVADPVEEPFDGLDEMAKIREVGLDEANIRSVIWSTGFGPKFDFLDPSLVDESGRPRNTEGVCEAPGLYCVGFTWLRRRISGLIAGVDADAKHVAEKIRSAKC
jgi:putative flavoprotein involved in K+ transport